MSVSQEVTLRRSLGVRAPPLEPGLGGDDRASHEPAWGLSQKTGCHQVPSSLGFVLRGTRLCPFSAGAAKRIVKLGNQLFILASRVGSEGREARGAALGT